MSILNKPCEVFFESNNTQIKIQTWGTIGQPFITVWHDKNHKYNWWRRIGEIHHYDYKTATNYHKNNTTKYLMDIQQILIPDYIQNPFN